MDGDGAAVRLAAQWAELLALIDADGMFLSWWTVPVSEVVFVKGILEAYPGMVAMHSPPGRVVGTRAPFALATTAGWKEALRRIMRDLAEEVDVQPAQPPPPPP